MFFSLRQEEASFRLPSDETLPSIREEKRSNTVESNSSLKLPKEKPFDYYILSLTWNPSFCLQENKNTFSQCSQNLGFVIHGLWPQYNKGYPSYCNPRSVKPKRKYLIEQNIFHDRSLALYQWQKHGSCTGLSVEDYFNDTATAYHKIRIPSFLNQKHPKPLSTVKEIKDNFIQVNPKLSQSMITIQCNGQFLQEIRICMDKNLQSFRPCGVDIRDRCRKGNLRLVP